MERSGKELPVLEGRVSKMQALGPCPREGGERQEKEELDRRAHPDQAKVHLR